MKVHVESGSENFEVEISICLINHVVESPRGWNPTISIKCTTRHESIVVNMLGQKGVLHYELLQPGQSVNAER